MPVSLSQASPRLDLPYIQPAQAQKHVTHNEAIRKLDAITQLSVISIGSVTPPGNADEGSIYALGAEPTGSWTGRGGLLACHSDGGWFFVAPGEGWLAWNEAEGALYVHSEGRWRLQIAGDAAAAADPDTLGINAAADETNRLAVAATATLFSHDGAGHQLKLNKAAPSETASILFQSDYTGHAEIGLAGDAALSVKLSADGDTWTDVLRCDPAAVAIGVPVTGAAVQDGPEDSANGKLLRMQGTEGPFGLGSRRQGAVAGSLAAALDGGATKFLAWNENSSDAPWGKGVGLQIVADGETGTQLALGCETPALALRARSGGGAPSQWQEVCHSGNVVGPLSETPGQGSSIIEFGENEYGRFTRFVDGTQICNMIVVTQGAWTTQNGPFYRPNPPYLGISFPMAFSERPNVTISGERASSNGIIGAAIFNFFGDPGTGVNLAPWSSTALGAGSNKELHINAIGRWR